MSFFANVKISKKDQIALYAYHTFPNLQVCKSVSTDRERSKIIVLCIFFGKNYLFSKVKMGQFGELWYLGSGVLQTLIRFLIEHITTEKQLKMTDLMDSVLLSSLIKKKVVRVERNIDIAIGSGGTGTERFTITAYLSDGSKLHLFIKIPTESLFERVFLTLFRVYDNEINFYANIRPHLPDLSSTSIIHNKTDAENSLWCPDVHFAKFVICILYALLSSG